MSEGNWTTFGSLFRWCMIHLPKLEWNNTRDALSGVSKGRVIMDPLRQALSSLARGPELSVQTLPSSTGSEVLCTEVNRKDPVRL